MFFGLCTWGFGAYAQRGHANGNFRSQISNSRFQIQESGDFKFEISDSRSVRAKK
jgi:hypothetical protein